jgi:hypothetical protein
MKCKIVYEYPVKPETEPQAVVIVKLHRHAIVIAGLKEIDAIELEEILGKAKTIKVRRYENGRSKKVQSDKPDNRV